MQVERSFVRKISVGSIKLSGGRVRNAWVTCPVQGDNSWKRLLIPHKRCRSLLGITFFPQNPWIPVHPLSQGMHPRRHFPPSYNRRPRYLRPYGRLRLLFLPCRRFSANHLPPEICLRTCPQCPDIRLRVTLPGNWKSSCLRWKIFKIELNEPF